MQEQQLSACQPRRFMATTASWPPPIHGHHRFMATTDSWPPPIHGHHRFSPWFSHSAQRSGSAVSSGSGTKVESGMGRRHHLNPYGWRLVVPGRGSGSQEPAGDWLGHEPHLGAIRRAPRTGDGFGAAGTTRRRCRLALPQRPGLPVRGGSLPRAATRTGHHGQHEPKGRVPPGRTGTTHLWKASLPRSRRSWCIGRSTRPGSKPEPACSTTSRSSTTANDDIQLWAT
jgi:hypothetical protein